MEFNLCNKCGACCHVQENPFGDDACSRAVRIVVNGGPYVKCRYLSPENLCTIYDIRPKQCHTEVFRGSLTDEQLFEGCKLLHIRVYGREMK